MLWKTFQICFAYRPGNFLFFVRVYKRDASAFESGSAETASVYAFCLSHDVVKSYELGRTTFIIMDRAFAAFEYIATVGVNVSLLPGFYAGSYPVAFRVEVACPFGKSLRHMRFVFAEQMFRDVPKTGILQFFKRNIFVGLYHPCGCFAFVYPQIVVCTGQLAGYSAEEYSDFKRQRFSFSTSER